MWEGKIRIFFLLALFALLLLPTVALADVAIDSTNFPDAGFRAYVQSRAASPTNITTAEIAAVTIISVSASSISDLTGIEHFTALKQLDCANIGITVLDVQYNTALERLNCSNTGITALDVTANTALVELYCYNTGITALDVSQNTALRWLDCYNTGITALDVSQNTALR